MSLIRLPKGEPVSVSEREGAIIDEYFRLLNATPFTLGYRQNPFFSIVVTGSSDVGKKSILDRHYQGDFRRPKPPYDPTQQHPYHWCSRVNDQACIMTWDLTSLISDSSFLSQTVRDSHASLLVYDVSNSASFEYLSTFYDSLQSELSTLPSSMDSKSKKKPIFIVANKVDLPATGRVVAKSEGEEFAARIGAKYLETSAKDNMGVTEAINMAITYGLIHCAEAALPDLRKAVAERDRSDGISNGIWKTIVKCVGGFAGKIFVKSRC